MKTRLINFYKNKETEKSKSVCLQNTGFIYKIQIASNKIKSKTLSQFLGILLIITLLNYISHCKANLNFVIIT